MALGWMLLVRPTPIALVPGQSAGLPAHQGAMVQYSDSDSRLPRTTARWAAPPASRYAAQAPRARCHRPHRLQRCVGRYARSGILSYPPNKLPVRQLRGALPQDVQCVHVGTDGKPDGKPDASALHESFFGLV